MSLRDDDEEAPIQLEFDLVPQCHNCKHWWPNLHQQPLKRGCGTCDLDGARCRPSDSCGYHCEVDEDEDFLLEIIYEEGTELS